MSTRRIQTSVKLPQTTLDQIRDLARDWGPVSPLSQANVVIEAVQRSWSQMKAEEQERARAVEAAAAARDQFQASYGPPLGQIKAFGF
jgi:hypothetical protein